MNQTIEKVRDAVRVLLIDDSSVDNFINKAILSKEKCISEITIKSSGPDALEYLEHILEVAESFPDLIFLDIRMPRMNGFEFLEEYQRFPEKLKVHCKIYILSSSLDPLDAEKSKKYTMVKGHLVKPLAHYDVSKLLLKA